MNSLFDVISAFNGGGYQPAQAPTPQPSNQLFDVINAFDGPPQGYQPNILAGGEAYQYRGGGEKLNNGDPITRSYLQGLLLRPTDTYMDGEGNAVAPQTQDVKNDEAARNMLVLMDKYGVNKLTDLPPEIVQQLPSKGIYEKRSGGFWSSLGDFITNPAVLMALGAGWAGIAGAGAGAAAAGGAGAADLGSVMGAAGELGAGGALGGYGGQLAASTAAAGGAGAASNNILLADSGTTMTDVGPGLLEGAAPEAAAGAPNVSLADTITGQLTGAGNASQAELAALIESGTAGNAGAAMEGLAGIGSGGGMSAMTDVISNSTLGNVLGGGGGGAPTGSYQAPWESILSGVINQYFTGQQNRDLQDALRQANAAADPFASQRPRYQQQFASLTSTPSAFFDDPAIADIMDASMNASARKLASQGYNSSGNMAEELTRVANREAFGQYMPYTQMIGQAAGANINPSGAGQTAYQSAVANNQAQQQQNAGVMRVLGDIWKGQRASPGQTNQNLGQFLYSLV